MGRIRKFKAILLDLDDTLYSYKTCNEAGKKAAFLYLSRKLKQGGRDVKSAFERARVSVKHRIPWAGASHSRLLYFQNCIEFLTDKSNAPLALQAEKTFW